MALESNTAGIQVNAVFTPQKPIAYTCVVTTPNTSSRRSMMALAVT